MSTLNHIIGLLFYLIFLGYFGTSIASLILNYTNLKWYGVLLNVLVLIFEMIGPFYTIYFMMQLLDGIIKPKQITYDLNILKEYPKVACMVPVRNANPAILEITLSGIKNINYPYFEVFIGDDFSDVKYSKSYEELCKKFDVNYYRSKKRSFKSGILNQMYEQTDAEYIAYFDIDQTPEPTIIHKFVAVLEKYPEYSFVQAKFEFKKIENLLHAWEVISYYQLACSQSGKMLSNSVIWHGCNACFRKDAAYPIPEGKLSEDFDHSIELFSEGLKGCWLEEIGAHTMTTETFDHKVSQMFRWTTGQVGAVMDHSKKFVKSRMSFRQSIDVFISSTLTLVLSSMYLVGIVYALIYIFKIPIYRALVLENVAMVIVPVLIGIVYTIMITATSVYSFRNSEHKINIFHILFYLLYSSFVAPILLIPTIRGLLRKNKLNEDKYPWNRRIRLYLISTIYSIIGLIFTGLTILTIFDNTNLFNWYPQDNFFFMIFGIIAFMLVFSLPFVAFAKRRYKESPLFQDENVYI